MKQNTTESRSLKCKKCKRAHKNGDVFRDGICPECCSKWMAELAKRLWG